MIGVIKTAEGCVEWSFPADPSAVRTVRRLVRNQLGDWGLDALGDVAVLLVSELVTNSLSHAAGPIGVRLVRPDPVPGVVPDLVAGVLPDPVAGVVPDPVPAPVLDAVAGVLPGTVPDVLRVEVSDSVPDPPRVRAATGCDESGRGLQLVSGAALRWGTRQGDEGKTVWFELPLPG